MCMSCLRQFAAAGVGGFMLGSDSGVIASALARLKATGGAEEDLLACVASASIAGVVLAMTFGGRLVDRLGRVAALRFATGLYLALAPLVLLAPGAGVRLLAVRVGAGAADGLLAMALGVYLTENLPTDVRGKGAVISQLAQTFGNLAGGPSRLPLFQ
jgi:SP family sugar:H+ symporter-like MFS transporter